MERIKERRFVPVIFYTALPASVQELENPLVKVAEKSGGGFAPLDTMIREYLSLPIMRINRELSRHVDETLRDYLWNYVPQHWEEFRRTGEDDATLAYLLCRRVAASLDLGGAEKLALRLPGAATDTSMGQGKTHPLRYYIMPPSPGGFRTGDILKKVDVPGAYWIVLTPWCDLIVQGDRPPKAEHVLLAQCLRLDDFDEYNDWTGDLPPSRLRSLIGAPHSRPQKRQEGRYHFLPAALELPDLLVDFQKVDAEPIEGLKSYSRIATLTAHSPNQLSLGTLGTWAGLGHPILTLTG